MPLPAIKPAPTLVALALLVALGGTPANADAPAKIWVATAGADGPACGTEAAPCRTFGFAVAIVADGGEVGVLTAGDYGILRIDGSVSIVNDGAGEAGIALPLGSGTGVFIGAGAGDVVSLRSLVIDGHGSQGQRGMQIQSASAVHIQNCVIKNFQATGSATGLFFNPVVNTHLFVSDTIIFNNGSTANTGGILILPLGAGSAEVVLDRVHLENNVFGLKADGTLSAGTGAHVVIRDSVVSGNVGDGILAVSAPTQAPAFIVLEHTSVVSNAGTGIKADGPRATVVLNDDTITRNGAGISALNSGQLISFGNNKNFNNLGPEGVSTGAFSQM